MTKTAALILAAGKGTRMHSDKPKVLQSILNEPMLAYVISALEHFFAGHIWTVVGHKAEMVSKQFEKHDTKFILQKEQKGTGHALQVALPELLQAGYDNVVIVNGDVPLIDTNIFESFLNAVNGADLAFATLQLENAGHYGRVLRENDKIQAIIEAKDYDESIYGKASGEVNSGLYFINLHVAKNFISQLTCINNSSEYYITDLVSKLVQAKHVVHGVKCGNNEHLLGVNSPFELSMAEEILCKQIVTKHLESGVIIHAPHLVRIGPNVGLEPGTEIFGPCELYGQSHITSGALIQSHCVIIDSNIAQGAKILSFSHLEQASVGKNAQVGPYGRLRPGATLKELTKVGNFVEIKKSMLESGAKVNHLSYIGDAHVGEGANIGAGTITCNYDGVNKHKTNIGAKAFIGSNTALIAPVNIGDNSLIAAGSVITKDVANSHLGVTRPVQKNLPLRKQK